MFNTIQLFPDKFKFSSETKLNFLSQCLVSQTEGKRYHDIKEIFDSAYALSKKIKSSIQTSYVIFNSCK